MNTSRASHLSEIVDCAFYLAYAVVGVEIVAGFFGVLEAGAIRHFIGVFSDPLLAPPSGGMAVWIYAPIHLSLHSLLRVFQ